MAAPIYINNNTVLAIANLATETWDESSDAGWDDAGAMVDDSNLYYQGDSCVSAQFTKDGVGTIIYAHGTGITIPTDGAIIMWHMWAAPPALATKALGGVRVLVGDSFGDFEAWIVAGSDFPPEFIWNAWALNPLIGTPDYTVGTPAAYSYFGTGVSALAQARGNPNAMDGISYGRCEQEYTLGEVADPATFSGYALIDNDLNNRYGLLREFNGAYLHQGLMSFGTVATLVYFKDANVDITIMNTENVTANFNRYEVNHIDSVLDWTAIGIKALGTVSKGDFIVVANATVNKTSCTFTDMNAFTYQSNSTLLTSTYRRCGLITQGSAIFTSCTFDTPSGTVAMLSDTLGSVTKCTFNSSGTGHAVDLGTISADIAMNWGNYESGYTDSSSGNETILVSVDAGITLTINVQTGASTPSVYNIGTGTVLVVSGAVSIDIHVEDQLASDLVGALVYIDEDLEVVGNIVNTATNATGDVSTSYSGAATSATVRIRKYGYKPYVGTISLLSDSQTNVTLITDPQQS